MIRAFVLACGCGVAFVAGLFLVLAIAGGSRPAPVAATPAAERPHHFKTTSAALELRDRMGKLDAEARCKSSVERLRSGECD
jgi:hypothetical protein